MTAEITTRPSGEPGWVTLEDGSSLSFEGVTDNGGETFDRYTAGFEIAASGDPDAETDVFVLLIGPTGNVPNGVCMHGEGGLGDDETRVAWEDIPEPVQRAIVGEFDLFVTTNGYQR